LEVEVGLDADLAKKVAREINRFIFAPVKDSLAALYKREIISGEISEITPAKEVPVKEKPRKKDIYREPIE
jgi:hypothetical protein